MPTRVAVTPVPVTSKFPTAFATLTFQAADPTNKEKLFLTGREILVVFNSDSGAHNVIITSVAHPVTGRAGTVTLSVGAGAYKMIGPFALEGWAQSDNYLYFEAADATIGYAVILT